jgi:RNA polymerase sigma factor (sigma-70 family)
MRALTTKLVRQISEPDRRTDGELLESFLRGGTESDFGVLVRRHGPMIWGICRRSLHDPADAEDAFQAVFLVLLRRGHMLVGLPTIGLWLHRVAVWTACNLRRRNTRRLAKRLTLPEHLLAPSSDQDLALDLDSALLALPEKFRSSIVLCHLLGFSRADAAAQLGCAERTLSMWLSRGLAKLRQKLGGLDPSKPFFGIGMMTVPAGLYSSVARAAVTSRVATIETSVLSATVSQLVEGVISMFCVKKATLSIVALLAAIAFGVGIGVSSRQLTSAAVGQEKTSAQPLPNANPVAENPKAPPTPATDIDPRRNPDAELKAMENLVNLYRQVVQTHTDIAPAREERKALQIYIAKIETLIRIGKWNPQDELNYLAVQHQLATAIATEIQAIANYNNALVEFEFVMGTVKQYNKEFVDTLLFWHAQLQHQAKQKEIEAGTIKLQLAELEASLKALEDMTAVLKKQKEPAPKELQPLAVKGTGAYFQLTIGTKDAAWPFLVKEFGQDGKPIGTTAFENATVLGRFLARAMKDSTGPKELRITGRTDTSFEVYPIFPR